MQIITVWGIRSHQWLAWQQHFFRYFLFHVMASRFLSSSEDEIRQLLEEKDQKKNTKRTYKVAQEAFHEYLLKRGIAEPTEKSEIPGVLKRFYVEVR